MRKDSHNLRGQGQKAYVFAVLTMVSCVFITACGQTGSTGVSAYEAANEDCASNAIKGRFLVHYKDGTMEVISAESEPAFLSGFMVQNQRQIQYAEPDYKVTAAVVQPLKTGVPITQTDNWGPQRIAADTLWQQNIRGQNVVVAVVDTGMDLAHPQLSSQVAINTGEQGKDAAGNNKANNGLDDDANGFVDDAYGYDFYANAPLKGDYSIHGTHVSGIIAAHHADTVAQAGDHVEGVAPEAKILPLAFLNNKGEGTVSNGVRAILYAVQRGAKVINASWGGNACSRTLRDAVASLSQQGITLVTAAGNSGANLDLSPEYPASLNLPSQLTIGATGSYDLRANFSNYGYKTVHLFAPGFDIVSTIPGGAMGSLNGTSMATPFVSGAVALLLSAEPTATTDQMRQALYSTSFKSNTFINVSRGRLDLKTTLSTLRQIMGKG